MSEREGGGSNSSTNALALVGAIARILNGGGSKDAIGRVAARLHAELPARAVTIWVRQPGGAPFAPFAFPDSLETTPPVHSLEALPPALPDSLRLPLVHDGQAVGMLELDGVPAGPARAAAETVADLLAPFVAFIELSEDLAFEVAVRAREVEEQRRFTSLVIDSLPVGLYVIDREYRIQIWNRKRETGTQGVQRGEVVGRRVFEVLTRQSAELLKEEFDEIFASGRMTQLEIEVPDASGTRYYRISKIPMRLDGDAITHVITIGEDVTEWHEIHQRIMQSEKLAAIGQLAAGVMHEINNPLATIGACAAAMESRLTDLPAPQRGPLREYVDIIDKEVERCTNIVDGLLDFSRPKGKEKRAVAINTDRGRDVVPAQAPSALQEARRPAGARPGPSRCAGQRRATRPGLHDADAERPRRNGGRSRDPHRPILPRGAPGRGSGGRRAGYRGRDPAGRTAEDLRAVLYHQATGPRYRARPLDLLRDRRGAPRPARGRKPAGPGQRVPGLPSGVRRMKILVVEDDPTVGQYVKRGLEEHQNHADLVDDGLEALRLASSGQYDLLVLDLRLPGMTGLEIVRTLRDRGVTTPILILTAQDAVDFKVQTLRAGADDYVTKPFAFEELLARVEALGRRPKQVAPPVLGIADLALDYRHPRGAARG